MARLLLPFLGYQAHVNRVLSADVKALAAEFERRDALLELIQHQAFARVHEAIGPLHADINALEKRLDEATAAMKHVVEESRNLHVSAERTVRSVWPRVAQLDLFLNEVRRSLPNPPEPEQLAELPTAFDDLYPALEEAFRGSSEDIMQRLAPYVDDLRATPAVGPVLDFGSGRGELLRTLADAGIEGYGVDLLESNVERCRALGLRAEQGDAIVHLAKLAEWVTEEPSWLYT